MREILLVFSVLLGFRLSLYLFPLQWLPGFCRNYRWSDLSLIPACAVLSTSDHPLWLYIPPDTAAWSESSCLFSDSPVPALGALNCLLTLYIFQFLEFTHLPDTSEIEKLNQPFCACVLQPTLVLFFMKTVPVGTSSLAELEILEWISLFMWP